MLNAIIRFSLQHRLLVIAAALLVLGYGGWQLYHLPIDVLPDLNRPRVTVMTEVPGMAPEEVEVLITFPLEAALNGATGVQAVRSSSGVGLSVVNVEFNWGTDIYIDRQIVAEKLSLVADRMPEGVKPQLAPISSIMGQIMIVGMWSEGNKTSPLEIRTLADWVVRQRLLTIPGVSQVLPMGGGRKQFQVLVNPDSMLSLWRQLTRDRGGPAKEQQQCYRRLSRRPRPQRVPGPFAGTNPIGRRPAQTGSEDSQRASGALVAGGQRDRRAGSQAGRQFRVRPGRGRQVRRRPLRDPDGQQAAGDRHRPIDQARYGRIGRTQGFAPAGHPHRPELYQQKRFIDLAIHNVIAALRDGGILVAIILFVFLLNFRTTFITLTAIPLSIVVTGLVFKWFDMSINTMTLGGLAVAIGELVDDAIVDVENIFRRLA